MDPVDHDLVIIGAGPAGLTAGLYAARSRLKVVLLERFAPGGQTLNTDWVDNYPGFPEGISGFDLIDKMKAQADRFELDHLLAEVEEIVPEEGRYRLNLAQGSLSARAVIIATGAEPSKLGIQGEAELTGRGVSYCGTCDAPFYKDKVLAAVGGGDTACQEAIYLTRFAKKVFLIHRRDELRAQKINQEKVLANEKISLVWDTVVDGIEGQNQVKSVTLRNVKTNQTDSLAVDGIFIWVGIKPNTGFCAKLLELDQGGFILTDSEMATPRPGVFAAGDCRSKLLRQISTAVGDGATAAFNAEHYIESLEHA
ncbi:MAG: thioredoxin-disulfide reductase [Deltaproteobacteria bacterium]|nr:thioredoxin-disulfide reductase [Deltaproteobacteria bacterium]